jgi:hypothetical protein
MTATERAVKLRNKYSKEYLRQVIKGYLKQDNREHWKEVAIELGKLYKQ